MFAQIISFLTTCCSEGSRFCDCFPCLCPKCACICCGSFAGLVALVGMVRVVVRKGKVEVAGDDPREQQRVAELLKKAHYTVDVISGDAFPLGPLHVDAARLVVTQANGTEERLLPREAKILKEFAEHPGEVIGRDHLLRTCWGFRYWGTTRTVDQSIANLRKKLGPDVQIVSIRGEGYRLEITAPEKAPKA